MNDEQINYLTTIVGGFRSHTSEILTTVREFNRIPAEAGAPRMNVFYLGGLKAKKPAGVLLYCKDEDLEILVTYEPIGEASRWRGQAIRRREAHVPIYHHHLGETVVSTWFAATLTVADE